MAEIVNLRRARKARDRAAADQAAAEARARHGRTRNQRIAEIAEAARRARQVDQSQLETIPPGIANDSSHCVEENRIRVSDVQEHASTGGEATRSVLMLELLERPRAAAAVPDPADAVTGIFFGDPKSPGRLRALLEARVDAVPAGGEISWVTYYLRDERLADALIRAHRRGVCVNISVEGTPRVRSANRAVIAKLRNPATGIGAGLRVVKRGLFRHLHEKLYCFSHPHPVALAGSFNPSGNQPEDARMMRRIGDQDRGHNFLVELGGGAAERLFEHARALHDHVPGLLAHFPTRWKRPIIASEFEAYFFPRLISPLDALLRKLVPGSRLRIAASHLRDGSIAATLVMLAATGVHIEVLTEETARRVPPWIEQRLVAGGIAFARYHHPDDLPMHNKFLLAETPEGRWSAFGSFNLTRTSRWLNTELLVVSEDQALFDAFADRWDLMKAEMAEHNQSA